MLSWKLEWAALTCDKTEWAFEGNGRSAKGRLSGSHLLWQNCNVQRWTINISHTVLDKWCSMYKLEANIFSFPALSTFLWDWTNNNIMNTIRNRSSFCCYQISEKCFCPNRLCAKLNLFRRKMFKHDLPCTQKGKTSILYSTHCLKMCAKRKAQRTIDKREGLRTQ